MSHDTPSNIFEAASHMAKDSQEKTSPQTDEDPFQKGKKLYNEIASTVETALKRAKITPSQYRDYVERPQNFSQKDWDTLQQQRQINEQKLKDLTKKIHPKEPPPLPSPPPKDQAQPTSPPKPPPKKPRPITKRQWLNMR